MTLKLLVAYDGTAGARQSLAYVAPLAKDPTVELSLLTVARSQSMAAGLFDEAARLAGTPIFEHVPATGTLYGSLLQAAYAKHYDLIVFSQSPSGWSRLRRWRRRPSLSSALPTSSLLVRGSTTRMTRALICTGGDQTVIADAQLTARLARRTGAHATILHVLSQVPLVFGRGAARERITEAFAATGAPEMQYMREAESVLEASGVQATIKVRIGLVVEEIVSELNEGSYDLLVIGAHRSQGLVERLLLEDVAAAILPESPVPVLVVKAPVEKGLISSQ
jgi:nucleotide-binding universal stress UspA family protein